MRPGEARRIDLVHAAGAPYRLELELRTAIGGGDVPDTCSMSLLALDGMWLPAARPVSMVPLVAGQRASVVVSCSITGIYFLQSHPDNTTRAYGMGPDQIRYAQNLITIIVSGGIVPTAPLPDLSTIARCAVKPPVCVSECARAGHLLHLISASKHCSKIIFTLSQHSWSTSC
jgi:hypothetical protein